MFEKLVSRQQAQQRVDNAKNNIKPESYDFNRIRAGYELLNGTKGQIPRFSSQLGRDDSLNKLDQADF